LPEDDAKRKARVFQRAGTFYDKDEEKRIADVFHLYERVVFIGQKLPNGEVADCNAPRILDTRLSEAMMTKRRVTAW
jgi:hypothetical protein